MKPTYNLCRTVIYSLPGIDLKIVIFHNRLKSRLKRFSENKI